MFNKENTDPIIMFAGRRKNAKKSSRIGSIRFKTTTDKNLTKKYSNVRRLVEKLTTLAKNQKVQKTAPVIEATQILYRIKGMNIQ